MKKTKLLALPLKILSRRMQKNTVEVNAQKNASQLSSKNVSRNFTAFDLIDNDVS